MKKLSSLLFVVVTAAAACKSGGQSSNNPPPGKPGSSMAKGSTSSAAPTTMPTSMPATAGGDVARGKYLVEAVMQCADCHTKLTPQGPDMAHRFAGGLEFPDKFGTWVTPNITQDKKTGIGDWTDQQIIDAIRLGKFPDGSQMIPIMPYMTFNVLTDADAKAVVAYLRTLAPIENQTKGNKDLQIPRPPAPTPPNQDPGTDPAKVGAYLGTLMECADCHTPVGKLGMDMTKRFAGGQEFNMPPWMGSGTIVSANITSDPDTGIGKYTDAQLMDALTKGVKANGQPIYGPMVFHVLGWNQMKPDDLQAVAKWVKTIPPVKNTPAKSTFKPDPKYPNTVEQVMAMMKAGPGAPPGAPASSAAPGGKLGTSAAGSMAPAPGGKLGTVAPGGKLGGK